MEHIIIAPHPDDEVIGCGEVLMKNEKTVIVYTDVDVPNERKEEALKLKEHFKNIKAQMFLKSVPAHLLSKENIFYFPDPINETHPEHRKQGMLGEEMARTGFDVVFYSTNMQAPYIHSVKFSEKEEVLNKIYPSQKSLWEKEKKYILFEGRCKWLF